MLDIGRCFYLGHGVVRDFKQAFTHFEKAYEGRIDSAKQQSAVYLGLMYFRGEGVDRDFEKSKFYLEPILEFEYPTACILLSRIAFKEFKFIKSIALKFRAVLLIKKIRRTDPSDPRIL